MQSSIMQSSRWLVRSCPDTAFAAVLLITVLVASPVSAQAPAFKDVTGVTGLKISTDAACWVDLDNDGWVDVCVSGGIWKNHGGQKFTRVADVPILRMVGHRVCVTLCAKSRLRLLLF